MSILPQRRPPAHTDGVDRPSLPPFLVGAWNPRRGFSARATHLFSPAPAFTVHIGRGGESRSRSSRHDGTRPPRWDTHTQEEGAQHREGRPHVRGTPTRKEVFGGRLAGHARLARADWAIVAINFIAVIRARAMGTPWEKSKGPSARNGRGSSTNHGYWPGRDPEPWTPGGRIVSRSVEKHSAQWLAGGRWLGGPRGPLAGVILVSPLSDSLVEIGRGNRHSLTRGMPVRGSSATGFDFRCRCAGRVQSATACDQ